MKKIKSASEIFFETWGQSPYYNQAGKSNGIEKQLIEVILLAMEKYSIQNNRLKQ